MVTTLLDISGVQSERGRRPAPGWPSTPRERIYVHYTNAHADNRLVEYTMDGATVDLGTRPGRAREPPAPPTTRATWPSVPTGASYLALGDGDNVAIDDPNDDVPDVVNPAQDRTSLLGKILRINPRASATPARTATARQPVRGPVPRRAEVWAPRPAQPVAVLVRLGHRRPLPA